MVHSYRTLRDQEDRWAQWNQWLVQQLGQCLLHSEQNMLTRLLDQYPGKHRVVLIGVQHQSALLNATRIDHCLLLSPLIIKEKCPKCFNVVETTLDELPLLTGSIDLAIIPHMLELVENPRQLLAEVCRIIKPEGHVVIVGLNPYSLWGIKRLFAKKKIIPWSLSRIDPYTIKQWLLLADFYLEQQETILFRPPIAQLSIYKKLCFLEWIGRLCWPIFGGVYVLVAKAKVIPITPIRLQWKQSFNGLHDVPVSVSSRVVRSAQ